MPKLILATLALLHSRPVPPYAEVAHDKMHARTRTRESTRRLRAAHLHDAYFDLSPLDLDRRH
jgi:hypothetical protein